MKVTQYLLYYAVTVRYHTIIQYDIIIIISFYIILWRVTCGTINVFCIDRDIVWFQHLQLCIIVWSSREMLVAKHAAALPMKPQLKCIKMTMLCIIILFFKWIIIKILAVKYYDLLIVETLINYLSHIPMNPYKLST